MPSIGESARLPQYTLSLSLAPKLAEGKEAVSKDTQSPLQLLILVSISKNVNSKRAQLETLFLTADLSAFVTEKIQGQN